MIWLYYCGFALILSVIGPFLLWQRKARAGLSQKLGIVPDSIRQAKARWQQRFWFHAVSVGEFNAIQPLLQTIRAQYPHIGIFVSTTTATGQKLAQDKVGDWATVFYFPFDLPWALNAWLNAISPQIAVIAETEIWPGFTYECARRNIKLCCVNGRISPRSFKGYKRFGWFFAPVLRRFSALAVQTGDECRRYVELGASADTVHVTGNLKFDGIKAAAISPAQQEKLRQQLNLYEQDLVIVGGSTHEGEEELLLQALKQAKQTMPKCALRLIIAPRHPERFTRVCQLVETAGFQPRRFSRQEAFTGLDDVYILDTIGQLNNFYAVAHIAFVGGTIAPIGGHSLIEPYAYAVPVICGPHTEKTRDIACNLLARKAMRQATDGEQLKACLIELVSDPKQRRQFGAAGQQYLDESQGAVERTIAVLAKLFTNSGTDPQSLPEKSTIDCRGALHDTVGKFILRN